MRFFFLCVFLLTASFAFSQQRLVFQILDSATREPLPGATVLLEGAKHALPANEDGRAIFHDMAYGRKRFSISFIEYRTQVVELTIPRADTSDYIILLVAEEGELDEVIVEATRSNRSVADLPTRTEVLTEEIDEAASMEPSRIAHLITHSTGIQVQTTAASSNGAVVRIQGLNGRYTQMLKDGFPLFGGFSGSLDVLQIPPLDLRQVEYIKGSASTLYGGGAIGGLVNLLSKKPDANENLLHVNASHIGSRDLNAFMSRKKEKFGFTNLASFHTHAVYDADKDGYSDLPEVSKFAFNPRLFFYPSKRTEIYVGGSVTHETRKAGDVQWIEKDISDSTHYYTEAQESHRYTSQFSWKQDLGKDRSLTVKNSFSLFDRDLQIRTDKFGGYTRFSGQQQNSFSEINYHQKSGKHDLIAGLNFYTEDFAERRFDTLALRDQSFVTGGAFLNHLWDASRLVSVETGLRVDHAQAKTLQTSYDGELFILPRINVLCKINSSWSLRGGGGMGYRMPTLFSEDAEPLGYANIAPIDMNAVEAERSYGVHFDIKYRSDFGNKNMLFTFNQMFFYNTIDNPVLLQPDTLGGWFYGNANGELISRGFETQMKWTFYWFTWFVGYTYTDAYIQGNGQTQSLTLTPVHSIKGDLLFVEENKWRIGWDYEYKSEQLLSSGRKTRSLFSTGIVVERTLGHFVIFLNAENITDTRQTRYESLLTSPNDTPQYTEVWAPLDGFFFNAGLKIKF